MFCFPDCNLLQGEKKHLGIRAKNGFKQQIVSLCHIHLIKVRKLLPRKCTYLLDVAILKPMLTFKPGVLIGSQGVQVKES